ncbi:MAG: long-chain fatty acid--CoA ligase [Gammaproteobacteria bacterium]|nr:long-chain fatty acid--CoA ligase [Gammaproteobacteria bacterium]
MLNNIGLFLTKRAFLNPEREAYVDGNLGLRLSFAQLNARCNRLASALLAAGIQKEDRVGLLLMNSAEFVEAFFALGKIGAVAVPLNWRLVPDELEFILKDSGCSRLIFSEEFVEPVTELHSRGDKTDIWQWLQVVANTPCAEFADNYVEFRDSGADSEPEPGADEDAMMFIMYTSGTTGLPKGVVHTHKSVLWGCLTISATIYYQEGERYLSALPMFHVGSLTPLITNIYQGATSIVMRNFDPLRSWELIESEKITSGLMVPAMLNFMLQVPDYQRFDHSALRWCMAGAAPVPTALIRSYLDLGIEIHQVYGLTETCGPSCVITSENALNKIGSTGKAFFHTDIQVVDDGGQVCKPGESGEVWVRAEHNMREYWNRPDATAETIVDGWLRTGDVAVMDEEGFVYIQDRIKDMIISGGEKVYPAEVENALQGHPKVLEAAVIGMESAKWGESPLAIIVKNDDSLTEEEILEYCRGKLARFKQPVKAVFVDTIPRNPSGKILKRVLRVEYDQPAPV